LCQKILRGHDTWQKNLCGHATWKFAATVCTQGGKIGNLEKVGGYLQEIFLQGGIGLFTIFFISFRQRRLKLSHI
jgi:hypothetical protein